ncbi:Uncharacterised protein [Sphingobacterium mizutaii]|uniref:Uncharacterized protein n=1 Tax=Sphingobacterium mizutaii TaxID=1010 RepID=A0AAJ4X8L8_9SPHI|nr:hypothetical protein [Sphingobacterium mizutaii]SDL83337.1 hypothetical protein SAMN05192578_11152 [Sphingobacterium mizutaii]SNV38614.1 Uncharacterised protein [Sphingobacterium mizutaii]
MRESLLLLDTKLTKPTKELRDTNSSVTFEAQKYQTDEGAHGYHGLNQD